MSLIVTVPYYRQKALQGAIPFLNNYHATTLPCQDLILKRNLCDLTPALPPPTFLWLKIPLQLTYTPLQLILISTVSIPISPLTAS